MEKVTISDLGATLADITGVPQPTVMMHARRAREAGLLNKKGHGRGAAQMEPSDAAHLLGMIVAAPLAGPSIKHTVENWKRYADLHVRRGPNAPGKWKIAADLDIPQLAALGADHTLFEFLVSVIDAAKSGDLQSEIERLASENHGILIPDVRVTFHAPRCFVRATVNLAGADLAEEKPYGSVAEIVGDLRQIREFGLRTILTVGESLR
ncbi:MAG: hypothetical protein KDJ36_04050 [Hyphomicrobiaceae bacterium]|nr:hypothetical protein [Hyphomicrobiaceae bacterium]